MSASDTILFNEFENPTFKFTSNFPKTRELKQGINKNSKAKHS